MASHSRVCPCSRRRLFRSGPARIKIPGERTAEHGQRGAPLAFLGPSESPHQDLLRLPASPPEDTYERRRASFLEQQAAAARRSSRISRLRLVAFLLLAVPLIAFESASPTGRLLLVGAEALILIAFAALVAIHSRSRQRERWFGLRVTFCEEGLRRIRRDWEDLPDLGPAPTGDHPYAADLDLFGPVSLSRLLGSVATTPGRQTLRRWLLDPSPPAAARSRQEAVAELSDHHDLRETLSAWGRLVGSPTAAGMERFIGWTRTGGPLPRWVSLTSFVLPAVTLLLILASVEGWVGQPLWLVPILAATLLTIRQQPSVHQTFKDVSSGEVGLAHYARLFEPITEASFRCPPLTEAQAHLGADGVNAPEQLAKLLRLVNLSDARRNAMFHWPIQVLTLWDFHVARALERWRVAAGPYVEQWVLTLGEMDALGGLAALHFENPQWTFPELSSKGEILAAKSVRHPYLRSDIAVANDVEIGPPGSFLLVTGSNMSGKSTLLRALGVNVVLARAGGPVAAATLRLPPVRLETSMRIQDSLAEGISFFMAELTRLKGVVDAARQHEAPPVLFLLDEILQGTNTVERQIAARTVIRHLLDAGAIGAVTTHDLHLAVAPDLKRRARAVHFQETFGRTGDELSLHFDYRLRPGLATSTNALALMELVGLRSDAPVETTESPKGTLS